MCAVSLHCLHTFNATPYARTTSAVSSQEDGVSGDIAVTTGTTLSGTAGGVTVAAGSSAKKGGRVDVRSGNGAVQAGSVSIATAMASAGAGGDLSLRTGSGAVSSGNVGIETGDVALESESGSNRWRGFHHQRRDRRLS